MTDEWVSLFSGGKDSAWALHRALETGLNVTALLTVHPAGDSYMYHTPATELARLAAESIGIELIELEPDAFAADATDRAADATDRAADATDRGTDSGARGDAEIEPLEAALRELQGGAADRDSAADAPLADERPIDHDPIALAGVTAGAVESEFQTSRIEAMCDRLGIDLFAPLWQRDPVALAEAMIDAGFEITIVQVAAYGLDASWLGRTLDRDALADLRDLNDEYGVHVLGEGGEFETLVTDGPHMDRPIEIDAEPVWEGSRGHLRVTDARLG
ncbi:Dph6-related ATP pyrophosphatase [Halopenitus persicus]|uniref:TIGR00289 family protein n=1 Tax=Halopenitus persicus TaxID=1048396 RepID=A0A1H3J6T9_9EURY|nr:diphthine--ammonia ligase [Halopenitus persicus]SDY35622.1 TIGR00289 family protein [Halopenitus persicus]